MVTVIDGLRDFLEVRGQELLPVGFVPTMGNLHAGHLSLLEEALSEFETVYFSIFVNPKQFGPHEDFNKYPRTLEADLKKITTLAKNYPGKSIKVFSPTEPREVFAETISRNVSVEGLKDIIEGECRPGHFDGVATVVFRLFELVRPTRAYFGLKDYQQYLVIKKMVKDLGLSVEIIGMPIIREESGLALSSRNQYLSSDEKIEGLELSRSLREISQMISGERKNLPTAIEAIKQKLRDKRWNYLEVRDAESLSRDLSQSKKVVLLGVYQLRNTRLLDNLEVPLA